MCTVSEDVDEHLFMPQDSGPGTDSVICIKCQNIATIILQKKNWYCEGCVIQSIKHKFRAALGKSRLIKPDERVLLLHSGGKCSSVLIHLLSNGLSESSYKKLKLQVAVLFVDDGIIRGQNDEYNDIARTVEEQVKQYGFDLYICPLSEAMEKSDPTEDIPCVSVKNGPESHVNSSQLKNYLVNIKSDTSRLDIIEQMHTYLLVKYAEKLKCPFIFMADHSPKLATKLLSNTCLGRGSQLSHGGFMDNRCENVTFLRPMKDITEEELEIYFKYNNLFAAKKKIQSLNKTNLNCIQNVIKNFITTLQENYPATISTIQKTGEKLGNTTPVESKSDNCIICESILDTDVCQSSALQATEFSKKVSQLGPAKSKEIALESVIPPTTLTEDSCAQNGECPCKKDIQLSRQQIELHLCYACRRTLNDVTDLTLLPDYIKRKVIRNIAMAKIHSEIKDFLL